VTVTVTVTVTVRKARPLSRPCRCSIYIDGNRVGL
jgi:hypothetical protein